MKVRIKLKDKLIAEDILLAKTIYTRLVGLMFLASPPENSQGLLIDPCNSIHTFFMKYGLDIVFLDSRNKVVKIIYNMQPWRMSWIYFRAARVLELPAGNLPLEVKEGDILEVEYV